ncbi:uncharacterized protein LOC131650866 [Vicia villosa]|uniref:uncharacterized protein LOC131650866 n=1 Tax=Vicia villosa TaxID=3911 RepID=UPI00273BD012|nr:uncharacterized protein LOC131650866 [Vicia villosa]
MDAVLMKGPYTLRNISMLLKEWKPGFDLQQDLLRTLPLWIKLPQLPLHLWGARSLSKIGSAIGVPLVTDECTTSKLRVSYARILVEVDITKALTHEISIKDCEGIKLAQKVEYEWRPLYCDQCQKIGHNCKTKRKEKEKQWIPKPKPQENQLEKEGNEGVPEVQKPNHENEEVEETWTTVATSKREKETRVKKEKAVLIRDKLGLYQHYVDNYNHHVNGRIWITWDESKYKLQLVSSSDQYVHCGVYDKMGSFKFWLTGIYALNQLDKRKVLWKNMITLHQTIRGPWFAMGDFNNVAGALDRIGGNMVVEYEYKDFQDMMSITSLSEMDSVGDFYTWNNKHVTRVIYSRIDRVLRNIDWFQANTNTILKILPPSVSDHALLCVEDNMNKDIRSRRFKFYNYLTEIPGFEEVVKQSWSQPIQGEPMFVIWRKLQRLKPDLTKLSRSRSSINEELTKARTELTVAQESLVSNRMDATAIEKVKMLTTKVIEWNELEESMMRQRTKIDWLRMQDGNNAYFYATLKIKSQHRSLNVLHQDDGTVLNGKDEIHQEVLKYYRSIMGTKVPTLKHVDIDILRKGKQITRAQGDSLIARVTEEEIRIALKGIGDLKAPGIDGYGAKFFKSCWHFIKDDVVAAAQVFFEKCILFRAFNGTVVTLIPKTEQAKTVKEYRPIAGCTTFYKILSKVLTNRLGKILPDIIHQSQATFIPGQVIHNHILLAFELMKGYTRKGGTSRCMLQIDFQKAYDMVDWNALECILCEIGMPRKFVSWIMCMLTTVSYRFNVNGEYTDLLQARRGLRQGDPISPLLFVILMEYLNRTMVNMQRRKEFKHHSKCKRLAITHLSFADDALLWGHGAGCDRCYLELNWLHSGSFIWTGKAEVSRKSLVAWKKTCSPIHQGGLNIINLEVWNSVALLKCLWNLCKKTDALWVKWVHTYYLKGNLVETINCPNSCSWILKTIFNKRSLIPLIQQYWNNMLTKDRFVMKEIYLRLIDDQNRVEWRNLMRNNYARPRALFTLWLSCHSRLPTMDRLSKLGMIQNLQCVLCVNAVESHDHLFFECCFTKNVWAGILNWLGIPHTPLIWRDELKWLISNTKGKGWKHGMLKMALAETLYFVWQYRNRVVFQQKNTSNTIVNNIIYTIVYRGWMRPKYRIHIANLMM